MYIYNFKPTLICSACVTKGHQTALVAHSQKDMDCQRYYMPQYFAVYALLSKKTT